MGKAAAGMDAGRLGAGMAGNVGRDGRGRDKRPFDEEGTPLPEAVYKLPTDIFAGDWRLAAVQSLISNL